MEEVHYENSDGAREHLIVFRNNHTQDHYRGEHLHPRVEDNGSLYVQDGSNDRLAAYAPGTWDRVTPDAVNTDL